MSEETVELLETFETQLRNERYDEAEETLRALATQFSDDAASERTYTKAIAASERVDDERAVSAYTESAATIDLRESQFLLKAGTYLSAPDALDREEVLSLVETLVEAEETLAERQERARSAIRSVTIPPQPTILTVTGKRQMATGERLELSVPVANVGDESTAELTLTASPGDGLAVERPTRDIGSLGAGEERSLTVVVSGQTAGEWSLALAVTADGTVVETKTVTVAVLDEGGTDTESGGETTDGGGSGPGSSPGGDDDLLPIVGGVSLGAIGGGAALYKYLESGDSTDSTDET